MLVKVEVGQVGGSESQLQYFIFEIKTEASGSAKQEGEFLMPRKRSCAFQLPGKYVSVYEGLCLCRVLYFEKIRNGTSHFVLLGSRKA